MQLFIFKPSEQWGSCGGGLIIAAKTIEEAQDLILKDEYGEDVVLRDSERDVPNTIPGEEFYNWVLIRRLNTDLTESEVILFDYNWA